MNFTADRKATWAALADEAARRGVPSQALNELAQNTSWLARVDPESRQAYENMYAYLSEVRCDWTTPSPPSSPAASPDPSHKMRFPWASSASSSATDKNNDEPSEHDLSNTEADFYVSADSMWMGWLACVPQPEDFDTTLPIEADPEQSVPGKPSPGEPGPCNGQANQEPETPPPPPLSPPQPAARSLPDSPATGGAPSDARAVDEARGQAPPTRGERKQQEEEGEGEQKQQLRLWLQQQEQEKEQRQREEEKEAAVEEGAGGKEPPPPREARGAQDEAGAHSRDNSVAATPTEQERQRQEQRRIDVRRSFGPIMGNSILGLMVHAVAGTGRQFALDRVLCAVDRLVGYSQGMNFVGAFLLNEMAERDGFCLLVWALKHRGLAGVYRAATLVELCERLQACIAERLPRLHDHLTKLGMNGSIFGVEWFTTAFVISLRRDLVLLVLDLLFADTVWASERQSQDPGADHADATAPTNGADSGVADTEMDTETATEPAATLFTRVGIALLMVCEDRLLQLETDEDFVLGFRAVVREAPAVNVLRAALFHDSPPDPLSLRAATPAWEFDAVFGLVVAE